MGVRWVLAVLAAAFAITGTARAETALPYAGSGGGEAITHPHVLSAADVRRYREIFRDEQIGRFETSRKLQAELGDDCLIGYVKAEHLLSPHSGHSTPAELNSWLRRYGALSIADRIRDLSKRRTRRRSHVPALPRIHWRGGGYEDADPPEPPLASYTARTEQQRIDQDIQRGEPDRALTRLKRLALDKDVPIRDLAHLAQHVSASYLAEGDDNQAFALAASVARSARDIEPRLDWSAGLAAFRLGRFADAAEHFRVLSGSQAVPSWTRAAAAFWAARSYMKAENPAPVVSLLTAAAREEPTFYGLLAERILGQEPDATFRNPVLTPEGFETLLRVSAIHRAVALWQVGRSEDVQNEMNRAFGQLKRADGAAFAALADDMVLPNLELRASETQAARGLMLSGLFPVPKYQPRGGYTVDPSVVLAIARIESRFEADAVSQVGARGLMQLMPATARHLAGHRLSRDELEKPTYNLALGQRYIKSLLRQVNGNLLELAAAYNAGPANLSRWMSGRPGTKNDPLLFIESVPSPETRSYIKRFMMYHWLYRRRLDQDSPTLDETAAGKWPLYQPQSVPVASVPAAVQAFHAEASN